MSVVAQLRHMLKSKIHQARVTGLELEYEGSITMDRDILDAADILPGEMVHVLNLNNGARLTTYAISTDRGSGTVCLNGPAARTAYVGDRVTVLSYCLLPEDEAAGSKPRIVRVDGSNRLIPD